MGISKSELTKIMPKDFILWIDPREVSYRVGEYGCLTKLSREEMAKTHSLLKGSHIASVTPRTASPSKRAARSSPITIPPWMIFRLQHQPMIVDCSKRLIKEVRVM